MNHDRLGWIDADVDRVEAYRRFNLLQQELAGQATEAKPSPAGVE